jgi:gamma-carbonic anhydrase
MTRERETPMSQTERQHRTTGLMLPYRGRMPVVADDAFVAPGTVVIGDVEIGAQSNIWFNCVLRGDDNPIRIGARTNIQDATVIHVHTKYQGTFVGDDVTVGHMAVLHACNLHDLSFVGIGAIVLDEATVESHAMLAGGAMLTPGKTVRTGELWAGRPAKLLRRLSDEEIDGFPWFIRTYVERGQEYASELGALAAAAAGG